jgi:hypothetical protein
MKITKGPLHFRLEKSARLSTPEAAAALALSALAFLTRDMEKIERFFSLTGVDPSDVRLLAQQPGFQCAVLDHLAQDEHMLLEFAEQERVPPEAINMALRVLGGGEDDWTT